MKIFRRLCRLQVSLIFSLGVIGCGNSPSQSWPKEKVALRVRDGAAQGNLSLLNELAGENLIVDLNQNSMTLLEFIETNLAIKPLEKIVAAMSFKPSLRLSPLGDGTVQRLWVYPGFALFSPTCWSDDDKALALESALMTISDIEKYEQEDSYQGISLGFNEDGKWIFILEARVSRTPPKTEATKEIQCK